jgi:membrane associated rhomboid family serine protease
MDTSKWAFLGSPRFWALVIGAIGLALYQDGIISLAWATAIGTITGGFIGIRTLDRAQDKKVEAAAISALGTETITFEK